MAEQTSDRWRKQDGGVKWAQARQLMELEKEHARLTQGVGELSPENQA